MGTWGVGMQANDTALDEIAAAQEHKSGPLEYLRENIDKWLEPDEYGNGRKSILGVADYCLDQKIKITDEVLKKKIKKAVAIARRDNTFRECVERELALDRFVARLDGKKVSKRALASDNAGLLSKISDHLVNDER